MNQAKALIESKTFRIAALQALAGVVIVFSTAYPQIGWLMMAKSLLDMFIRTLTSQPIGSIV